jgi:hypothetical protein
MNTVERLDQWRRSGVIDAAQHSELLALVGKERFSVFFELNALLYIGVLSLVAGLAWTFRTHFAALGDVFILLVPSLMMAAAFYYCFRNAPPFSAEEVESPGFAFDYVVYLSCLLLSVELGYIEFRFQWLTTAWPNYLLFVGVIFLGLAYRFDNRFVLSLALSSLAGWLGLKVSRLGFVSSEALRVSSLGYAAAISAIGALLGRQGVKRHFLETYLHVAANVGFIAVISGLWADVTVTYLLALVLMSAATIFLGTKYNRFAFVVYGTVFGYIGISIELLRHIHTSTGELAYLVTSGGIAIVSIATLARRFGQEE